MGPETMSEGETKVELGRRWKLVEMEWRLNVLPEFGGEFLQAGGVVHEVEECAGEDLAEGVGTCDDHVEGLGVEVECGGSPACFLVGVVSQLREEVFCVGEALLIGVVAAAGFDLGFAVVDQTVVVADWLSPNDLQELRAEERAHEEGYWQVGKLSGHLAESHE